MESKRNAKGAGSFKINSDGTVTHRKSCGYKENGQRKIITVTSTSKAACIKLMSKKEAEWYHKRSLVKVDERSSVADLCNKHLRYQVDNNELKHKSIDRRECTIVNQIEKYEIGKMQIHTVLSTDIESHILALINEEKLSESSITKTLDVLNAAFSWAVLQGMLEKNPVEAVKPKLVKRLKKMEQKEADEADVSVFSDEEVTIFEVEATKVNKRGKLVYFAGDYMLFLLYTGMRCGELIALRWKNVDWQNRVLTIGKSASMIKNRNKKSDDDNNYVMYEDSTKNQRARVIELSDDALRVLKRIYLRHKSPPDKELLIAPTMTGRMNTAPNLEHRMEVILKNAGLNDVKGGLHTFRKTFATQMYEQGWKVEEIAAYIGDLESTTRKYYIAIRKKLVTEKGVRQIVRLPQRKETKNE